MVRLGERVDAIENNMGKKVVDRVRTQLDEREDIERRKMNIIVHNLPETHPPQDRNSRWYTDDKKAADRKAFCKVVTEAMDINENVSGAITDIIRLGVKQGDDTCRPLRVSFKSIQTKREILGKAKLLNKSRRYKMIYINPDLTPSQRKHDAELRQELKIRRDNGENIIIKRGKIVNATIDHKVDQPQNRKNNLDDGNVSRLYESISESEPDVLPDLQPPRDDSSSSENESDTSMTYNSASEKNGTDTDKSEAKHNRTRN